MAVENWLTLAGATGGLIAFCVGLWQYSQAQRWKRLEFVAAEIKEFERTPSIQNTFLMLDWDERAIEFYPEGNNRRESERVIVVDAELIQKSLSIQQEVFSDREVAVRDTFDEFFNHLERFDHYLVSGLVKYSEFHPYLAYWLRILTDRTGGKKPTAFVEAIAGFIDQFGYRGVQHLLGEYRRYGHKNDSDADTSQPR
jgi:hypothetical protein